MSGSSDDSTLVLTDPGVMSEHFMLSLNNKRIMVENLSSSGVLLEGKYINGKAFLKPGNTLTVGDNINIRFCSIAIGGSSRMANIIFPIIIILIIGVGVAAALRSFNSQKYSENGITAEQWSMAYSRIYSRLRQWDENMQIPKVLLVKFTDAWIRDKSGDKENARKLWSELYNVMTIVEVKGVSSGMPISECVTQDPLMLYAMMNRVSMLDPLESLSVAAEDMAYLDAFWSFVSKRIEMINESI